MSMLSDPVVGEDYGDLRPSLSLRREPDTRVQCGGPVPTPVWARCSLAC